MVEIARDARIRIGFREYCRVGVPLTVLTLLLGWLILIAMPVCRHRTLDPAGRQAIMAVDDLGDGVRPNRPAAPRG